MLWKQITEIMFFSATRNLSVSADRCRGKWFKTGQLGKTGFLDIFLKNYCQLSA